ncbi:MAG: hypothetical protein KC589_08875 [Nanoarchaeota archaeon]|nr:hypothetical protein [Nanoarchaeota archaeon]MCA9497033.1 hypothetical protein [Nanoarchaeota archaeon]
MKPCEICGNLENTRRTTTGFRLCIRCRRIPGINKVPSFNHKIRSNLSQEFIWVRYNRITQIVIIQQMKKEWEINIKN